MSASLFDNLAPEFEFIGITRHGRATAFVNRPKWNESGGIWVDQQSGKTQDLGLVHPGVSFDQPAPLLTKPIPMPPVAATEAPAPTRAPAQAETLQLPGVAEELPPASKPKGTRSFMEMAEQLQVASLTGSVVTVQPEWEALHRIACRLTAALEALHLQPNPLALGAALAPTQLFTEDHKRDLEILRLAAIRSVHVA